MALERQRSLTGIASASPMASQGSGFQITVHSVQDVYSNAPLFVKITVGNKKTRTDKSVKGTRAVFEEKMTFATWDKADFATVYVCKEKALSRPVVGVVKIPFPTTARYSRHFPLTPDEASNELGGECGRVHLTVVDLKEFHPTKYDVVDTAVADLYEGGQDLKKETVIVEMPTVKFPRHTGDKDFDFMCILGRGGFGKVVQVRYKKPADLKWGSLEETKHKEEKKDAPEKPAEGTSAAAPPPAAAVEQKTEKKFVVDDNSEPRLYPRASRTRHTCKFFISTAIQDRLGQCPSLRGLLSYHAPQTDLTLNSFDFLAALAIVPQAELRILCGEPPAKDAGKPNTSGWEPVDIALLKRTAQALQWQLVEEREPEEVYVESRGLHSLVRYLCSGFCSTQTQKAFGPLLAMEESAIENAILGAAIMQADPSDLERTSDLKRGTPRTNQATQFVRDNAAKLIQKFSLNIKALIGEENPSRARFNDLLLSLFRQVGNRNTALGIFVSEPNNFAIYSAELWRQFSWSPEDLVGVELLPPNELEVVRAACDTLVRKLVPDLPTLVGTHLAQTMFDSRIREIFAKVGETQPQLGEFFANAQHCTHYANALWRVYSNIDSEEIFDQTLKQYEHRVQMEPVKQFFFPFNQPTQAALEAPPPTPIKFMTPVGNPTRHFALKVIEKAKVHSDLDVMDEVKSMQAMKGHPFVCQLYYHWQTKSTLNMVIELVTQGSLEKIIKMWNLHPDHGKKSLTFTHEQIVRVWAAEIVMALAAMHDKGIIYRDLKPDNVLLDEHGHIRLIDMGIAYTVQNGMADADVANKQKLPDSVIGGAGWKAPEMLKKGAYNHGVDAWSLGLLIYYLLSGKHAFDSSMFYTRDKSAMKFIGPTGGFFDKIKGVSNNCKHLLGRLLQPDPTARLGAGKYGAREIMRHPFFGAIDWDLLTEQRVKGIRVIPEAHANTKNHALETTDDAKPEFASLKETMEGIDQRDIQLQLAIQAGIE